MQETVEYYASHLRYGNH